MSVNPKLKLVLCWHMHQPNYFDPVTGEYKLPWTYLHVIKDYVDMAAHLEAVPGARAVVNFAPILLEQIEDYAKQVHQYLNHNGRLADHLLAALASPALPTEAEARAILVKACLRANQQTIIKRFPAYDRLAGFALRMLERPDELKYVSDQYLADIVTWYHLGWLGETVRRSDARAKQLIEKAEGYTYHDRHQLVVIIGELLAGVLPRYRRLAEQGRIELSMTPYAHPIVPLLLDIESAREAMPEVSLPLLEKYPGGIERSHWHVKQGLAAFERIFGIRPQGCWPSEGSVSDATLSLLADHGLKWAASGETVLRNSLARPETSLEVRQAKSIHRPYATANGRMTCFFRDDGLSDLIGFSYSKWHADDAVADMVHHLENIATVCQGQADSVVSIILDGENAWEYYPENGYYFLSALYKRLSSHPRIELTTFTNALKQIEPRARLPKVVAGSWVYGTFSTWIGEPDKNRGWDMLADAKRTYDRAIGKKDFSGEQRQAIDRQLAVCEGSDWFWWFGDYNPSEAVRDFEYLYRLQLATLYEMLDEEPPEYLAHSFTRGGGNPVTGGVMRPGQEV